MSLRSTVSEVRHKIRSFGIMIAPSLSLVVADNVYTVSPLLFVNGTSLSFSDSCVTLTGFSVFSPFSCAYTYDQYEDKQKYILRCSHQFSSIIQKESCKAGFSTFKTAYLVASFNILLRSSTL